ncbi:polysaccharide biosynthesis/export family protein [Sphingomonas qomolangmaensis]|uniref:Polysaccharide export protein n=1 Tax=Sphingomonas qomolangmaensis TaxID=2918765 RepID=A0ABY5L8J5_9SPHN|nr:polysaccharide biosynthesis/export family protein [Sphingomonas qomolangmaensis]UUL82476.1 polysaccharide export protein [Sphingomonas qomolangmaensis]
MATRMVVLGQYCRVAACVAALLIMSGCGGRGGDIAYDPASFVAPDAPPLPATTTDYRLGAGDVVSIQVFKVDSLSGDQTIDTAGRVNLALLGPVVAAGRTTAEFEQALERQLGEKYLTAPSIAVTLKSAVQRTVTVDGSVQQPGLYPISAPTSLIKTIAMARGTAEEANPSRVIVFRQIDGQRMAAAFDLKSIRRGESPDPVIYADDIVVVDGSATSKAMKTVIQSLPFVTLFRPF